MKAYQSDIAHFDDTDTQVLGISVDSTPSNKRFATDLALTFPLLSDFNRKVSEQYGILNAERNVAVRTTYVVDKQGVVRHIEQGSEAIDPSGVKTMCSLLKRE
ncbi:MAG: redoxin domain-containing protein [Acidobacteria bacterium]|nr:redoxin domain-containing protein [Acidobacteriota bacterium]